MPNTFPRNRQKLPPNSIVGRLNGTGTAQVIPLASLIQQAIVGNGSIPIPSSGALNYRGAWDSSAAYNPMDVVTHLGSAYLCFAAIPAAAPSANAWDPATAAQMTLSTTHTTNDTATSQAFTGSTVKVNTLNSKSTGKWYIEFEVTHSGGFDNGLGTGVGLIDTSRVYAQWLGSVASNYAGGGSGAWPGFDFTPKRGALCMDRTNGKFWITPNVQASPINWNNSTSNDPGTNVGGITIGTVSNDPISVFFYSPTNAGQKMVLFSLVANLLIPAVPTGFSAWTGGAAGNTAPELDDTHWLSQGAIVVGTTEVSGGTSGNILYDNAGVAGEKTTTGSGSVVLATSPTLVTPVLGTPTSGTLTNCTGLPAASVVAGALANGMTGTTQSPGDNTTKLATDAFVQAAISGLTGTVTSVATGTGLTGGTITTSGTIKVADGTVIPQGRLSLSSGVAAQTADVVGGTSIYYVPYTGNYLPVVGKSLTAQLTLALDSTAAHTGYQQSGKNFDLFIYNDSGTLRLCTGPAWTNDTTRANAIDQTTVVGVWTNTASITLKFDTTASTLTATAGTALYVGTMRASADGQCTCQFNPSSSSGGSNTKVFLYNAYNRLRKVATSDDSTVTWTYAVNTWRAANNSTSNRISFIDGLGQTDIWGSYSNTVQPAATIGANGNNGTNLDSTTATPTVAFTVINPTTQTFLESLDPAFNFTPQLGFHYIQAMEQSGSGTTTFYGGINQLLSVSLEL